MKLRTSLICSLFPLICICQVHTDLIIKNGRIIDGTGNNWFYGDVAVKNGNILRIGKLQDWTATKTIDAKGMAVMFGSCRSYNWKMPSGG